MSEAKQQKLEPCLRCKSTNITCQPERNNVSGGWRVRCSDCGYEVTQHSFEHEAYEDWNSPIDLLPCPHCGNADVEMRRAFGKWHVQCPNKKCNDGHTKKEAAISWNRRAVPDINSEILAALDDMLTCSRCELEQCSEDVERCYHFKYKHLVEKVKGEQT